MKNRKRSILKNRAVKVPLNLTADPANKRGQVGAFVSFDHEQDIINVRFEDGIVGRYQFNSLEILHTPKAILYHLNTRVRELNQIEVETIRRIINLSTIGEFKAAFELSTLSSTVWKVCVTDTETFYRIKKDIRKHLGLKK